MPEGRRKRASNLIINLIIFLTALDRNITVIIIKNVSDVGIEILAASVGSNSFVIAS